MTDFAPAVLEVWRRARRLQRRGQSEGENFRTLRLELHALLRLGPADPSPLYAHDGRSPHPPATMGALTWPMAQELRKRLDAALRVARAPTPAARPRVTEEP